MQKLDVSFTNSLIVFNLSTARKPIHKLPVERLTSCHFCIRCRAAYNNLSSLLYFYFSNNNLVLQILIKNNTKICSSV